MSLEEYTRRRSFAHTGEPRALTAETDGSKARFVIQKHAASRLHYDLRLEMEEVLKSWAVPKGVPLHRGEKRLAIQVEDHPLGYAEFEGVIPAGQYGGGTVMIWDRGFAEFKGRDPVRALEAGRLEFSLRGLRLAGDWVLVRMRGEEKQWLLIRQGGDGLAIAKRLADRSAVSGKTMKQLAAPARAGASRGGQDRKPGRPGIVKPPALDPMMAKAVTGPPPGNWWYEVKFDGYRAIASKHEGEVSLRSRNRQDLATKFPAVAEAIAGLSVAAAVIDGEIVALDSEGRPSFQKLQAFAMGEEQPPIYFYAFDLPWLEGRDLRGVPIETRKGTLEEVLAGAPAPLRFSPFLGSDAETLTPPVRSLGFEGLLGKKKSSRYEAGRRSGAWVKLKFFHEQEFVVGGFTAATGLGRPFGAVLVGYYERGRLRFASKVGSGWSAGMQRLLYASFQPLVVSRCPFVDLPERGMRRWGQGITAAEMKRCRWLEPRLVCQVRFAEWTREGRLRQPVWIGLRPDKRARQVRRELEVPP